MEYFNQQESTQNIFGEMNNVVMGKNEVRIKTKGSETLQAMTCKLNNEIQIMHTELPLKSHPEFWTTFM